MDFSPKSVFWDCLYARCCEEMDMYLKPGSFWERIPNEHLKSAYSFALRYEYWRWFYELYFQSRIANRRPLKHPKVEVDLYSELNSKFSHLAGWNRWQCLTHKEKVKAARAMMKEFQAGSFASLDDYLKSNACYYKGATSYDLETMLTSKKTFQKQRIVDKLVAGVESLGWDWQHDYDGDYILRGNVYAFGRTFMLKMIFEEKFFLSYSLGIEDHGYSVFHEDYSYLMGLGPDGFSSFGFGDLDADVEAFMMMLSRLAWLVSTSLDDAEKGVKPEFVHHPPPPVPRVEERHKGAICGCIGKTNETTEEESELLALLKTEGFIQPDAQKPSDMYELIECVVESGSEMLFLLDTECVIDGSEYAAILEKLNTVSGEVVVMDATSFLDPEKSVAGVQFTIGSKVYKGKWEQDDDWMSAKFAELLTKAMEHFSGLFVALPSGDQCARILYFKSKETGEKVEKLLERIKDKPV